MQNNPSYEEVRNLHQQLVDLRLENWVNNDLFSFQWWLLLLVFILPWIIWWRFVEKKRIYPIMLFGSLLMILVIMLDDLGVELHLWSYPVQLFSLMPRLLAIDQGIIIVAHMFLYQYFKEWKPFIIANVVMALIFTYVFEPLTVWLGIYKLEIWKYTYSLPIYVLKAMFIKWVVDEFIERKKNTLHGTESPKH
jgi:hypothetical protein